MSQSSKIKLLRVLDILSETDEEHPMTTNQIVRELSLYGIEAERKSVLRDIATLQDYGYDVLLHADNKLGYYMASRDFEDWELKVLMDAALSASFLTKQSSEQLSKKISALSGRDGRKTLRAMTPIPNTVKNGDATTKNAIDVLLRAVRLRRKVCFRYLFTDSDLQKKFRRSGQEYHVSPYALIWRQDKYYLIGSFEGRDKLSYYRLDRIRELSVTDEPLVSKEEFLGANADLQIQEFVEQNLYNHSGKRTRLTLAVDADMLDILVDDFGSRFTVIDRTDTQVIVTVLVSDGWGLNTWLLQHGDSVQVLEPQSIRDEIIGLVELIRRKYQ